VTSSWFFLSTLTQLFVRAKYTQYCICSFSIPYLVSRLLAVYMCCPISSLWDILHPSH